MPAQKFFVGMKEVEGYTIDYRNLSDGMHQFDFSLGDDFFSSIESSLITSGQVEVQLNLSKHERMGSIQIEHHGKVLSVCDRCMEPLDLPLEGQTSLLVQGSEAIDDEDEEVLVPDVDGKLHLAKVIYDYVSLSIPITKYCDTNPPCHTKLMEKLVESTEESGHPVWNELKKLKLKD